MGEHYADFLFPTPSLARGVASIFDFWGIMNQYNISRSTADADALALVMDWRAVSMDLARAFDIVAGEIAT
jgi:hypothetical protein